MCSFGLSHFQRATLGARRRPSTPHPPPPLTSIAADSGRYILQTVEVSGRFAKRHLGSSSRSRQLQRSLGPVDGLQSCRFFSFFFLEETFLDKLRQNFTAAGHEEALGWAAASQMFG